MPGWCRWSARFPEEEKESVRFVFPALSMEVGVGRTGAL